MLEAKIKALGIESNHEFTAIRPDFHNVESVCNLDGNN